MLSGEVFAGITVLYAYHSLYHVGKTRAERVTLPAVIKDPTPPLRPKSEDCGATEKVPAGAKKNCEEARVKLFLKEVVPEASSKNSVVKRALLGMFVRQEKTASDEGLATLKPVAVLIGIDEDKTIRAGFSRLMERLGELAKLLLVPFPKRLKLGVCAAVVFPKSCTPEIDACMLEICADSKVIDELICAKLLPDS